METESGVVFVGWLEDLGDLLPAINQRTWAIIQTQNKRFWLVKLAESSQEETDELTTAINGRKYKIQGVATVLDLHKLVKNPYFVSKILSKNSLDNFYYMVEMAETRNLENTMIVDKLVKNEPLPQKALNFLLDFFKTESNMVFNKNTGQSELTLLLKDDSGKYVDRSVVEDGKPKHVKIRPYESIAASVKNLASGKGDLKYKKEERNKALINMHRAVADSLGYNLDDILDDLHENSTGAKLRIEDITNIPVKKGRLHQAIEKHRSEIIKNHGKIDDLLHDQSFLKEVIGAENRDLDPIEIEFLQKWLKEEEFVMRFSILKFVDKDMLKPSDLANYWKSLGLTEEYDGENYLISEMQSSTTSPASGAPLMGGAVRYTNILKSGSLMSKIENKEDEYAMDTYDMVKNKRKDLIRTIDRMRMQLLGRDPTIKEKVNQIAETEYDLMYNKGLEHEFAYAEARRKGKAFLTTKVRESLKRTENALLMSRYAERLFVLGLMDDIWGKADGDDDLLNKLLLARRFPRNLVQSAINKEKIPVEQTAIVDAKEATRIKNIEINASKTDKQVIAISKADPALGAILSSPPLKGLTSIIQKESEQEVKQVEEKRLNEVETAAVNSKEIQNIYGEYGVFSVLERIYQNDNLLKKFNISDFSTMSEKEFLLNLGQDADKYGQKAKLYDFYKKLLESAEKAQTNKIDTKTTVGQEEIHYAALASSLGLDKENNLNKFKDNFGQFFENDKGKDLFDDLKNKGLKEDNRLEFLQNLEQKEPGLQTAKPTITSSINTQATTKVSLENALPVVKQEFLQKGPASGIIVEIPIDKQIKDVQKLPPLLSSLKYMPLLKETPLKSNFTRLDTIELNCLYGEYGIYPVLANIYGRNNLLILYGITEYQNLNENTMLVNVGMSADKYGNSPYLYDFYTKMRQALDPENTAAIMRNDKEYAHLMPYLALGTSIGLARVATKNGLDVPELNRQYIALFRDKFDRFFENHLGKELFDRLEEFGLKPEDRFAFLRRLDEQGITDFTSIANMGLLTIYNQYVEATSKFFSKNIIFNPDINRIPVLGPLLYKPTQAFIKTLGFSGDKNILAALLTSKLIKDIASHILIFIKRPKHIFYSGAPEFTTTITSETQRFSLEDFYRNLPKEKFSITKAIKDKFSFSPSTKHKIEFAANTSISGAGFIASESVAKLVPPVWNAAWKFTTDVIMLKPFKYLNSRLLTIQSGLSMVIKILTYPITAFFFGCVGILALITFVIAGFVGSSFVTFERTDTVTGQISASSLLKVAQVSSLKSNTEGVEYKISITNISDKDVTIKSFTDEISLVPTCNSGLSPSKLGESGFIGKVENPDAINGLNVVGKTLKPKEKIEITVKIIDIELAKGSFINDVKVVAEEDKSDYARDIARIDVKESGCFKCPAGWAVNPPLAVYQGAFTTGGTHDRVEGIDIFSVPIEAYREIKATHDGTIYVNLHSFDSYGFNVELRSTDNTYMTIYGHLAYPPAYANGTYITKGTTIGVMGSTGLGDKHLHYEFRDIPWGHGPNHYACIAGEQLQMKNVKNDSYIPKTVPKGCNGFSSCNVKVN